MNEDKKSARLKEIDEYMTMLINGRLLDALPEKTLIELHQALGAAVSVTNT